MLRQGRRSWPGTASTLFFLGTTLALNLLSIGRRVVIYSIQRRKRQHPEAYRQDLTKLFHLLRDGKIAPRWRDDSLWRTLAKPMSSWLKRRALGNLCWSLSKTPRRKQRGFVEEAIVYVGGICPPSPLTRMPFLPTASSGATWHGFVSRRQNVTCLSSQYPANLQHTTGRKIDGTATKQATISVPVRGSRPAHVDLHTVGL